MKLEICANSFLSAKNAQQAGAHRIELCSELAVGGVTPNYGLLTKVMAELSIDTFVLIRPRSGNFNFSDDEFEIMKRNIQLCKEIGCKGIVSGVLNYDNTIDVARTNELVSISKPLAFTFHRAFDLTPNPSQALDKLLSLGIDRVLSSGQKTSAEVGLKELKRLNKRADNKIIILPGGGVTVENSIQFKNAGFSEIHASMSSFELRSEKPSIAMNSLQNLDESKIKFSDPEKICALLKIIR